MSTLKYILRILLVKIALLYFFLILLNIVSVVIPGNNALFDSLLLNANTIAIFSFFPVSLLMLEIGIPHFKKCKKCGSRWQIFYETDSGRDVSHPEYEHIFRVTECLPCRNHEVRHIKREVKNDLPRRW